MKQYINILNVVIDFNKFYRDYSILRLDGSKYLLKNTMDLIEAYSSERNPASRKYDDSLCYLMVKKKNEKQVLSKLKNAAKHCLTSPDMKREIIKLMLYSTGSKGGYCYLVKIEEDTNDSMLKYAVCLRSSIAETNEGLLVKMNVATLTNSKKEQKKRNKEAGESEDEKPENNDVYMINDDIDTGEFMELVLEKDSHTYTGGNRWYMYSGKDTRSQVEVLKVDNGISKSVQLWYAVACVKEKYGQYLPRIEFQSDDVERYNTGKRKNADVKTMLKDYFNENGNLAVCGETDEIKSELITGLQKIGIDKYEICTDAGLVSGKCNLYGLMCEVGSKEDKSKSVRKRNKKKDEIVQHITRKHIKPQRKGGKSVPLIVSLKELMMMDELAKGVIRSKWTWKPEAKYEFFMPDDDSWNKQTKMYDAYRYMQVVNGNIVSLLKGINRSELSGMDEIAAGRIGRRGEYAVRITNADKPSATIIIRRTEKIAVPDIGLFEEEFRRKQNGDNMQFTVGELVNYIKVAYGNIAGRNPKLAERHREMMETLQEAFSIERPEKVLKWADAIKEIKDILLKELGITGQGSKTFNQELFNLIKDAQDNAHEISYGIGKGNDEINLIFPSISDITYTDKYYISAENSKLYGTSNSLHSWTIKKYSHLYETEVYGNHDALTEIYEMLAVLYVRYNMPTVLPFPFAYLRRA